MAAKAASIRRPVRKFYETGPLNLRDQDAASSDAGVIATLSPQPQAEV